MAVKQNTKTTKKEVVVEAATEVVMAANEEVKQPVVAKKRVIDRDEWVSVMNYTTGRVLYTSQKTGASLVFNEFGQTDEIQVAELITMKNVYPRYLNEPWLVVLDDDVVSFLGYSKLYENLVYAEELESLFSMPADQLESILTKAPRGMIQTVVSMAMKKIESNELDSMSTIRMLEKVCGVDLQTR